MDANLVNSREIKGSLLSIYELLRKEMIEEFVRQGHDVTGSLINSIEEKIIESTVFTRLDVEYNFYGRFVDTGRKAGVKRVPIEALEEWIRLKGFESDAKKIRGIAFAIQKTIFEKGISQPQSWNGENTKGWQTKVLERNTEKIESKVQKAIEDTFDLIITNIIREIEYRNKQN